MRIFKMNFVLLATLLALPPSLPALGDEKKEEGAAASLAIDANDSQIAKLRQLARDAAEASSKRDKEKAAKLFDEVLAGLDALPETTRSAFTITKFARYYGETVPNKAHLEGLLKKTLNIWSGQIGNDAPEQIEPLIELSGFAIRRKQYAQAEELMKRALSIAESNYGQSDPRLIPVLGQYKAALFEQKKLAEAEKIERRVIKIYESELEASSLNACSARDKLASLLMDENKSSDAEKTFVKAIADYSKSMGADSMIVASNMDSLADVLFRENKFDESADYYKRSLEIKEKTAGKSNQFLLNTLEGYAAVLQKRDKNSDLAKELQSRANKIRASLKAQDQESSVSKNASKEK